jgi:GNAT superfamily N-acetyltransferase
MATPPPPYLIEPLASHHDRAAFACGEPSLDGYLRTQAGQDVKRDLAACYVLHERDTPAILGYYTLSASSVELPALPPEIAKKSGRYPLVPAVLLGRLAVAASHQGQGLSTLLLLDAIRRVLRTGIGVKLVLVDALHDHAAAFYGHNQFQRFADAPLRLYLPMTIARDLFPEDAPDPADPPPA